MYQMELIRQKQQSEQVTAVIGMEAYPEYRERDIQKQNGLVIQ